MLQSLILALTLPIFLINGNDDSREYDICISLHPCPHDSQDLKKLNKSDYIKEMKCRIKRHMECIKIEIPDGKK